MTKFNSRTTTFRLFFSKPKEELTNKVNLHCIDKIPTHTLQYFNYFFQSQRRNWPIRSHCIALTKFNSKTTTFWLFFSIPKEELTNKVTLHCIDKIQLTNYNISTIFFNYALNLSENTSNFVALGHQGNFQLSRQGQERRSVKIRKFVLFFGQFVICQDP